MKLSLLETKLILVHLLFLNSLKWDSHGTQLAIGFNESSVQIWDVIQKKKVVSYNSHDGRVGALAWSDHLLSRCIDFDDQMCIICKQNYINDLHVYFPENVN